MSQDEERAKLEAAQRDLEAKRAAIAKRKATEHAAEKADALSLLQRWANLSPDDTDEPGVPEEDAGERALRKIAESRAAHKAADKTPDRKRQRKRRHRKKAAAAAPDRASLYADLCTAATSGDTAAILAAQCRWSWADVHGSGCPANRIARQNELASWVTRELPSPVLVETASLLAATFGATAPLRAFFSGDAAWGWRSWPIDADPPHELRAGVLVESPPAESGGFLLPVRSVLDAYQRWLALPEPRPRPPLAPVVEDWQRRDPDRVRMVIDKPTLIMPRTVAHVDRGSEGYYLARFGQAVHREPSGQLLMGFATEDERGPTLPANVWTMGLADAEKRGAVVPLALRIWVAAILHTPLHARHGNYPVQIDDLTLRRFLSWVYPGSRMPRPGEYWPRILAAREVINSTELPFEYPAGSGNLWARPVVTLATPLTRPGLNDPWPTTVHLPPGDGTGPPINFARLQHWSTRDATCYRALINLAYRWHIEGKRRMPIGDGNWIQRRDPKFYDKLTDAEAEALCYPPGTGAKRRDQRISDAHSTLEKLVRASDAEDHLGRLLPPSDGTGT